MKGAVLVAVLLGGFYIFTANVVMAQIKAMEGFYSNMDQYVSAAVNDKSSTPTSPKPLQTMMHPYTNPPQSLPN